MQKFIRLDIVHPLAQAYAERFTSVEDRLLNGLFQAHQAHPQVHMLSGHLQGTLLEMISRMLRPRRILEIGTFMGYSALCLAKGLVEDGELHTIELRAEDGAVARSYFDRSPVAKQIILHIGNALEIIPKIGGPWDMVFIDADKVGYADYYRLVLPLVRSGGVIIADNVLYHGEVLEDPIRTKNARAIDSFNDLVCQDKTVEKVLLTVRDGLLLIRKN